MPQSTTVFNACNVGIKLADATSVLQDISGVANEVDIELENALSEYATFSGGFLGRLECKRDGSVELTVFGSTAANEALALAHSWYFTTRGNRNIQIDMPSSAIGGNRYTGAMKLEKFSIPLKADDGTPIAVKLSLKADGGIAWATITS